MTKPEQKKTTPTARPKVATVVVNVDEKTIVEVKGSTVTIQLDEPVIFTDQTPINISSTSN